MMNRTPPNFGKDLKGSLQGLERITGRPEPAPNAKEQARTDVVYNARSLADIGRGVLEIRHAKTIATKKA